MRFDLGTLDSGEQSLPFGLLVYDYPQFILIHIKLVETGPVHVIMQTTEAQIDLRIRAVLSVPLLSASKLV